jgi:hypothetical protein
MRYAEYQKQQTEAFFASLQAQEQARAAARHQAQEWPLSYVVTPKKPAASVATMNSPPSASVPNINERLLQQFYKAPRLMDNFGNVRPVDFEDFKNQKV